MAESGPRSHPDASPTIERRHRFDQAASAYGAALLVVGASTLLAWLLFGQSDLADVAMVQLLGVVVVSLRFRYAPSLLAAALSALAFEFFFLPPYLSFAISNLRHSSALRSSFPARFPSHSVIHQPVSPL